jgi:hypothetical protein
MAANRTEVGAGESDSLSSNNLVASFSRATIGAIEPSREGQN